VLTLLTLYAKSFHAYNVAWLQELSDWLFGGNSKAKVKQKLWSYNQSLGLQLGNALIRASDSQDTACQAWNTDLSDCLAT